MRRFHFNAVLLLAAVGMVVAGSATFARSDDSLASLIGRADTAPAGQRPGLYTEIAERELQNAEQLYNVGEVDKARAALSNVVTYSDKASDAANKSRGKIKNTEIALRKMAERLRDLKRSLAFEDQAPVQAAADHLEKLRTDLLASMFGKGH